MAWALCSDPAIGYDLAHWQGTSIPWAQARELGVRWCVAKAWHGRGAVASCGPQLETARAAGVELLGRYAWLLPDAPVDLQVAAWTRSELGRDELPLTVDFEEPGSQQRGRTLVTTLERAIVRVTERTGRRPIIYTGSWYWQGYCGNLDSQLVAECPLWLAAYPKKQAGGTRYQDAVAEVCGGVMPAVPRPWAERGIEPLIWQFDGDRGLHLPGGIDCDVNVAAWARLRGLALPDTEPAPKADDDTPTWPKGSVVAATPLRATEGEHTVPLVEADFEGVT